MNKAIAYYRVSTKRQGRSGLGLEAQQEAVKNFVNTNDYTVTREYTEVESGKRSKRPVLKVALAACKKLHQTLLIAKLDRLSRNVAFISALLEAKIAFKIVDNPTADKFTLHILAAVAEKEGDDTSKRTIAALKAAKRRGVRLGQYGRKVLSKINRKQSILFAKQMNPIIIALMDKGIQSVRRIAAELNRLHIATFRNDGTRWHPNTVHRLLKKLSLK